MQTKNPRGGIAWEDSLPEDRAENGLKQEKVESSSRSNVPDWARESLQSRPSEPRLQKQQEKAPSRPQLDYAEPSTGSFEFISQVYITP